MSDKKLKKGLACFLLFGFIFPFFSFAQNPPVQVPENLDEAEDLGQKAIQTAEKEMPRTIQTVWNENILPVWKKMYDWGKFNIWDKKISPWLQNMGQTVLNIFRNEAERRKPQIEEEFQEEKQELKQEAPIVGKTLWEKFLELIK